MSEKNWMHFRKFWSSSFLCPSCSWHPRSVLCSIPFQPLSKIQIMKKKKTVSTYWDWDEITLCKGRLLPKQHLLHASSMRVTINPSLDYNIKIIMFGLAREDCSTSAKSKEIESVPFVCQSAEVFVFPLKVLSWRQDSPLWIFPPDYGSHLGRDCHWQRDSGLCAENKQGFAEGRRSAQVSTGSCKVNFYICCVRAIYNIYIGPARQSFGDGNMQTAKQYGNLGRLYQTTKMFKRSEQMHLKAIKLKESLLGEEDYEVGLSLGHLASLYAYDMKEYRKAEVLYLRSINISIRLFGLAYSGLKCDYFGLLQVYSHFYSVLQRPMLLNFGVWCFSPTGLSEYKQHWEGKRSCWNTG